ncbi:MAG: hypothetical protein LBO69_00375 [Ignavibacteria bacterium]|jgi:YVTN family beta-propeller protein|nr:hypothetical protein [Ignavibacteria bacterium]
MKHAFYISILIVLLTSCSSDEPYIDNFTASLSFIVQMSDGTLQRIAKDNSITQIELGDANIGQISKIKKFRGKYYLISETKRKVFILTEKTYELAEVDYSEYGFTPADICFPNATDAYVIDKNYGIVTIIDLTTNQLASIRITIDDAAGSIDGTGNQVYVTLPQMDVVSVIDTRTNTVVDNISVPNSPTYVAFTDDGTSAVVLSTTLPNVSVVDVTNRNVKTELTLGGANTDASKKIMPTAIISSPTYMYITANNGTTSGYALWRMTASTLRSAVSMSKVKNVCAGYSGNANVFYVVEDANTPQITLYDAKSNERMRTIPIPTLPTAIILE